jgi:hypothetical protein
MSRVEGKRDEKRVLGRTTGFIVFFFYNYTSNYIHISQLTVGDYLKLVPFPSWTTNVLPSIVAG